MTENSDAPERHTVSVEHEGETFELTAMAPKIEKHTERCSELLGGDRIGLDAQLQLLQGEETRPTMYFLSKLVGEPEWVIDAKFGANSFPYWSHGFGARYTRLKGILPELGDLLDTLARDRGLAAQIGRDIPLELTRD